jgi:DNA-binding FrmR family transcriptional regulator
MVKKFVYDAIVTGEDFCQRKSEIKKLVSYIKDSTNVLLVAKRRMGKTSLVHEVFENHLPKKQFITIYADIFDITDELDFARELYRATASALKFDLKKILTTLSEIFKKTTFDLSLSEDGTPSFSPRLTSKDSDELLKDVFQGLSDYLERHNLKAAFCIDEFQQISQVKKPLDATIRKYIQKHKNVCYIFSGSKRNTLLSLFKGQASPLMGMTTPMELGSIDINDFYPFIKLRIDSLSMEEFQIIYDHAEAETKLIQHIARNYSILKEEGNYSVHDAIESVLNEVDGICRNIIEQMSANGVKVIKILAIENISENLLSKDVLNKYNISKSSMASSIEALIKNEIIFKEDGKYYIDGGIGATFSLWCKKKLK